MDQASGALFRAGMAASARGWLDPVLIGADALSEQGPSGAPIVLVTTSRELGIDQAREVAALVGSGRQVLVSLDGPPTPDAAQWLPLDVVDYPGRNDEVISTDAVSTDDSEPSVQRLSEFAPPNTLVDSPVDRYCRFVDSAQLAGMQPGVFGAAGQLFQRLRNDYSLSLTEQPGGLFAGQWGIDDDGHPAVVWLQPGEMAGNPTVLIGSTLGVLNNWYAQPPREDRLHRVFSDEVIRWAEQPEAGAMISRVLGGMIGSDRPTSDPVPEQMCFPEAPPDDLPQRMLLTEPSAGFQRVFVAPGHSVEVPTGADDAGLVLIYQLPAYSEYDVFREVSATVINSLVRIARLLYYPSESLDGRRDPALAGTLEAGLTEVGFTSSLALAIGPSR